MNEQIVITKGDSGIELNVSFINNKKQPVNITGNTIEVTFVTPSKNKLYRQAHITNALNGECAIVLNNKLTNESDLWSAYFVAMDSNSNITAQDAIYYYVLEPNGGV